MKIIIIVSIILLTSLSYEKKIRRIDKERIEELKNSIKNINLDQNKSSNLIPRVNRIKDELIKKLNKETYYNILNAKSDLLKTTFNKSIVDKLEILSNLEFWLGIKPEMLEESHTLQQTPTHKQSQTLEQTPTHKKPKKLNLKDSIIGNLYDLENNLI